MVESTQVGDDAQAEHSYAAVYCYDDFGHSTHAHGIAAPSSEHAVFGRCLECRSGCAHVYTFMQFDAEPQSCFFDDVYEGGVIGFVHRREAWSCWVVGASQWIFGEVVDVVFDYHDVADVEVGVHASGGIADDEVFDAEFIHDAYGEGDLFHAVSFVVVESPLHSHDVFAAEFAEEQFAGMSFYGGYGHVGYVGVWYFLFYVDVVNESAESRAKYDGSLRLCVHSFPEEGCGFFYFFVHSSVWFG